MSSKQEREAFSGLCGEELAFMMKVFYFYIPPLFHSPNLSCPKTVYCINILFGKFCSTGWAGEQNLTVFFFVCVWGEEFEDHIEHITKGLKK